MVKSILCLYSAGTTTADNVASLVVPRSGKITLVVWNQVQFQGAGGAGEFSFELSAQSVSQFATSEAQGRIGCHKTAGSASSSTHANTVMPVGGIAVDAGQRIYLHRLSNGSIGSGNVIVQIYIE